MTENENRRPSPVPPKRATLAIDALHLHRALHLHDDAQILSVEATNNPVGLFVLIATDALPRELHYSEEGTLVRPAKPMPAPEDVARLVFEAIGAASVAWEQTPTGVFDSTKARDIGKRLLSDLGYDLDAMDAARRIRGEDEPERVVHRKSTDGRFTTAADVAANPDTTTTEKI